MSADVITINAILKQNEDLVKRMAAGGIAPWTANSTNTSLWTNMPRLTSGTSFDVCDTSGNFRCGATCTWTVPGGVTTAQFQMWGAGTGTVPGCCCSGSTFGSTGAYAIAILPVTPGQQYVLCAGCAYCCYAYQSSAHTAGGCQSYVTGPGLTNVCADGGPPSYLFCNMLDLGNNCCRFQAVGRTNSGPCICGTGTNYCFNNSCATCGEIPIHASARTYYGTANNGIVTGICGLHGGGCLDGNHYGYMISAPVVGLDHTPFTGSCCCAAFDSGTCCGGCRGSASVGNFFRFPGAGGFYNHMMGGSTYYCGDAGRMGMVRVTYC